MWRHTGLSLLIFLCFITDLRPDVYYWTDEKGIRHFSDTPLPGHLEKEVKQHGAIWTNSQGMRFVYLKPGTFIMGSNPNKPHFDRFAPAHKVTLTRGFQIQVTEVTREQWKRVMLEKATDEGNMPVNDSSGYEQWKRVIRGKAMAKKSSDKQTDDDDMPVCNASGVRAKLFIDELNNLNDGGHYQIPTEAQWEYACRAGQTSEFNWGADIAYSNLANCGETPISQAYRKIMPVGSYPRSKWFLYDMHGNAWEQCLEVSYKENEMIDPKPLLMTATSYVQSDNGSSISGISVREEQKLILRGGSYWDPAFKCRSAYRVYRNQITGRRRPCIGLRVIRIPED